MAESQETQYDVVIVGAGPGGYVGAIRCAQLGLKTALIEKEKTLGGTCLNIGCIPSKALLDSSEHYAQAQHELKDHGVEVGNVKLNLPVMMKRKDKVVSDLTGGIQYLMKKNKVDVYVGTGRLKSASQVEVQGKDAGVLNAKNIVIATGSVPVELPFMKFDGKNILSSTEALALDHVPEHMIVVGGGAIGLEMGSVWMRLGAKVTVVEYADKICGPMDKQISQDLLKILKKQGMEFLLSTKVTGCDVKKNKVTVQYEQDGTKGEITGDKVLVAVGRKPYSQGLGLEDIGVKLNERGQIIIDSHYATSVPGVYAVGDVVPGAMLAHKAEEEGVAIAEILAGKAGHVNYHTVPWVIYTWPEVAGVGYSEEEVVAKGIEYNVGSFPFTANGRAKAMGMTDGRVKIIADKKTDEVLGIHIVGPRASDMIAEAVVAMEFKASSEDIARSFHAHPTLAEVMREAALAVDKRARQM